MARVSIVIPVYNMEKYLERCVKSVSEQTLSDIEIILVDDGSTDGCPGMCDSYAKRDARIKVIHKPNGGLTSAWKAGSEAATGEYTGYIDSDDFIEADMFARLYERATAENADIACCGLRHIYENGDHEEWNEQMEFPQSTFTVKELREEMFPVLINDGSFMGRRLQPNRVTKIVKSEIVKQNLSLCDDNVTIGEDFQFSLCMFLDAHKVVILKDYFPYYYYMNDSSMTMRHDSGYMKKIKIMKENLSRISGEKGDYDFSTQIWNDFLCLTVLHIKGGIVKKKAAPYKEHKQDMAEICNDPEVKAALAAYRMPRLSLAEKMFVFFMKHHMYLAIYMAVRMYFR